MSNYRAQFDAHVADANSAISNITTAIKEEFFGMNPAHVRRLLENISNLLGRIDMGSIDHPEYLASPSDSVPQRAVNYVAAIKGAFESGPHTFLTNILPTLVEVEGRLSQAVGLSAYRTQNIKNQQVKALNQIIDRAKVSGASASATLTAVKAAASEVEQNSTAIKAALSDSDGDRKRISEIRTLAERLSKGNATTNPLEKVVRNARERFDEISLLIDRARKGATSAEAAAVRATGTEAVAKTALRSLENTNQRANEILQNATQAGLAGAYKIERDRLAKEQNWFSYAFLGGVFLIVAYAALFILPVFSEILENGDSSLVKIGESSLLLITRIVIVVPVIWALILINKRHTNLETLQMDYAAKAATALAYSGYQQEM